MNDYLFLIAFSAILYWFLIYQYKKDYEFGILGERIFNRAEEKRINPVLVVVATFAFFACAIVATKHLLRLLGYHLEYLYTPILIVACWTFIRDLKPIRERRDNKLVALFTWVMSVFLGIAWFMYPIWWTYDVLAFIVGINAVKAIAPVNLRYLLYFMIGILLYDVWGVFLSQDIVEVVQKTAEVSGISPPAVVLVPFTNRMLGVGDIVFPGLVIVSVIKSQIATFAFIGFGAGLAMTLFIFYVSGTPLPALLFLMPSTFIVLIVGSKITKKRIPW